LAGGLRAKLTPRIAYGWKRNTPAAAIISPGEAITDSRAPAFATANRNPISGPCTLIYPTKTSPRIASAR
jgi:hypothetical protein